MRDGIKTAVSVSVVAALLLGAAGYAYLASETPAGPARHTPLGNGTAGAGAKATAGDTAAGAAPSGPSARERIAADLAAGNITHTQSLLYRAQAIFGDSRLPERYATSTRGEDLAFFFEARNESLPVDTRLLLLPYLVRPNHPLSFLAEQSVSTQRHEAPAGYTKGVDDPDCVDGWFNLTSSLRPFRVWWRCGNVDYWYDNEGMDYSESRAEQVASARRVVLALDSLWSPMTAHMGVEPVPDGLVKDHRFVRELLEAVKAQWNSIPNEKRQQMAAELEALEAILRDSHDPTVNPDERVDFYVAESVRRSWDTRDSISLDYDQDAVTVPADPMDRPTASGFVLLSSGVVPAAGDSDARLRTTLAHEFFHLLQFARHAMLTNNPGQADQEDWWFYEASATWAQTHFARDTASEHVHPRRFKDFQASTESLHKTADGYASYAWPMFLEQETGGPGIIADIWAAVPAANTLEQADSFVDSASPFARGFRAFALRNLNDPFDGANQPLYTALDPTFPIGDPLRPRFSTNETLPTTPRSAPAKEFFVSIPSLKADYWRLPLEETSRQVRYDLRGIEPAEGLTITAVFKDDEGEWRIRALKIGKEGRLCAATEVILVIANGNLRSEAAGTIGLRSLSDPCECDAVLDVPRWEATVSTSLSWSASGGHVRRSASVTAILEGGDGWWNASKVKGKASVDNLVRGELGEHAMEESGPAAPPGFGSHITLIADPINCQYLWSHEVLVEGHERFPNGGRYPHFQSASTGGVLGVGFEVEGNDVPTLTGGTSAPAYLRRPGPDWEPGPRYTLDCGGCRLEASWAKTVDPVNGYLGDASLSWSFRPIWDELPPDLDE